MHRLDKRKNDQMREVSIIPEFNKHAEGSALIKFGDTQVICNASIEKAVPRWMQDKKTGWVTAEYGMLPRSTNERMNREAQRGKQSGRTMEIQRLIGRSLRQVVDLDQLTGYTITIDCDVIQADGGTRTASITGGTIALCKALKKIGKENAIDNLVAAISVGVYKDELILMPQYIDHDDPAFYAISKAKINRWLSQKSPSPIMPDKIRLDAPDFRNTIKGYQGFEAVCFLSLIHNSEPTRRRGIS